MKKLFILFLIVFSLTSCTVNTFNEDPKLTESERLAILEKSKTDTLTIIIKLDDNYYQIKDNKVLSKTNARKGDVFIAFILGVLVMFVIIIIIAISSDRGY